MPVQVHIHSKGYSVQLHQKSMKDSTVLKNPALLSRVSLIFTEFFTLFQGFFRDFNIHQFRAGGIHFSLVPLLCFFWPGLSTAIHYHLWTKNCISLNFTFSQPSGTNSFGMFPPFIGLGASRTLWMISSFLQAGQPYEHVFCPTECRKVIPIGLV